MRKSVRLAYMRGYAAGRSYEKRRLKKVGFFRKMLTLA